MAKTNDDLLDQFATLVAEKVAGLLGSTGPAEAAPAKAAKGKGKAKAEPEPDDDEDEEGEDEDENEFDRDALTAELKKKRLPSLKKMALEAGFDEEEVEEADKDTLVESLVDAAAEDAGVEDDEDEEDEDEDEGEDDELTREDYEAMKLPALKNAAKEAGLKASDIKGLDKDGIIDLILGEDEDEDEEDDEGDDDEWYTRDELDEMSDAELKALCKDNDITVPRGAKHKKLVDLLAEDE